MKNPAQKYLEYRNKGFDHHTAKELSGFSFVKTFSQSIFWIITLFFVLVWLTMDHKDQMEEQGQYVKSLERIVNGCTDTKGTTLQIGDKLVICKTFDSGIPL